MAKGCGPHWLGDKFSFVKSKYFHDECSLHDEDYKNKIGKWKADWVFLERNIRKAKQEEKISSVIWRSFQGVIFFILVKTPVISHISYYWNELKCLLGKKDE